MPFEYSCIFTLKQQTMNNTELIPVPHNFVVNENYGELTIEFKWSRTMGAALLVFALIWNAMLVFIVSKMPPEMRYFIVIHAGVGVFVLYYALCNLFNKTLITCNNYNLILKSGPLPAFNNKIIPKDDIAQLYFVQKVKRGKNGTTISYRLYMLDKNNRSKSLIKVLPDDEAARFIELKLEKFYKIENKAVAGEYDRKN